MSDWQKIPSYKTCFVCGDDNPIGLKLKFRAKDNIVETEYVPKPEHCGYTGIVHGGIISAILDEGMGWTGWLTFEKYYLTAELKIRLKKSVILGRKYIFRGELLRKVRNMYIAKGSLTDEDCNIYAEGEGKYFLADF